MLNKTTKTNVMIALTLALGLTLSVQAKAKCEGGTEFSGKISGTFCKSNKPMTWWSAILWCEAQGSHLAKWSEACPGNSTSDTTCENLNAPEGANGQIWTAQPNGDEYARTVSLSNGHINLTGTNRSNGNYYYALCK